MFSNRISRRLWYGQSVSSVGDKAFSTTLVLWVSRDLAAGRSWAPAAVGGLLIAAGAATILAGPLAGVLVDRWDRVAAMTFTEAARAAFCAALAVLSLLPSRDLPGWVWLGAVYLTIFALAGCGQLFMLAQLSLIADVVTGEAERARMASVTEATASAAGLIGPPLAAPLALAAGPQWALAANAGSYLASCAATMSVRSASARARPRAARSSLGAEFADGLRAFRRNRYLVALLSVTAICQGGTAAITTLNVFAVTEDLHAAPSLYGVAEMAMAAGYVAGALAAPRLVRKAGARTVVWAGLLTAGVLTVAYALARNPPSGLAILGLYGAAISVLNTAATPLLLAAAAPGYRGRTLAVFGPANQFVSSLWICIWGWLASTALQSFHAKPAGLAVNGVSLIFMIAGTLVLLAGIRAFCALPPAAPTVDKAGLPHKP